MVDIFDIAPPELAPPQQITIRGKDLLIRGLTAADAVALYARFPELAKTFTGEPVVGRSMVDLAIEQAAFIAAGLGKIGDADVERAILRNLTRNEQRELTQKIMELTEPGELVLPLLESGGAALRSADEPSGGEPATN